MRGARRDRARSGRAGARRRSTCWSCRRSGRRTARSSSRRRSSREFRWWRRGLAGSRRWSTTAGTACCSAPATPRISPRTLTRLLRRARASRHAARRHPAGPDDRRGRAVRAEPVPGSSTAERAEHRRDRLLVSRSLRLTSEAPCRGRAELQNARRDAARGQVAAGLPAAIRGHHRRRQRCHDGGIQALRPRATIETP